MYNKYVLEVLTFIRRLLRTSPKLNVFPDQFFSQPHSKSKSMNSTSSCTGFYSLYAH